MLEGHPGGDLEIQGQETMRQADRFPVELVVGRPHPELDRFTIESASPRSQKPAADPAVASAHDEQAEDPAAAPALGEQAEDASIAPAEPAPAPPATFEGVPVATFAFGLEPRTPAKPLRVALRSGLVALYS